MVCKEFLIFAACLFFELAFAELEKLEFPPRYGLKTIVCPCTGHHGVELNVTVRVNSCGISDLIRKKYVCNQEEIITKCMKAYHSSERHRRNSDSQNLYCPNGTIIPHSVPSSAIKGPPKAKINGLSRIASSGEDFTYKCSVSSNLSATVSWLFNGKVIVPVKNRHEFLECKTVLQIKKVLSTDTGNYTCVVQNQVGQATASSHLSVKLRDKGIYIQYMKLESEGGNTAFTGTTVNVTCKVQDYRVNNLILKNRKKISEGDRSHYEFFHMPHKKSNVKVTNLEIKNITAEDAGNYTCFASLLSVSASPKLATFYLRVVNLTEICDPGYYCPLGSVRPIPCPWGTYQPNRGQSSAHACKQCPDFDKLNNSDPFNTQNKPAVNITDCPSVGTEPPEIAKDQEPPTASHITPIIMVVGVVIGIFAVLAIIIVLYIAKRKRWLSLTKSNRTTKQSSPESLPCEQVFTVSHSQRQSLCENMQSSAESAQIVKKAPEIDYEPKYDVFICYSFKDISWVKELHAELEKRGFACCIDFKDFLPGAPIVENISQAICYSRKTIAVLTPDFVESNWCSHELQKALTRIRFHQVVPVVYRSCEIPLILRDRTYLDWENCHVKPYFWDHLEKALKQPNDVV